MIRQIWFREIVSDLPDDGLTKKKAETCSSLKIKIDNQKSVLRYTDIIIP
jgi:hypothetical protein